MTFEQAMIKLSIISEEMNDPKLSLDDAMKYYKESTELVAFCKNHIQNAKIIVETLNDEIKKEN